MVPSSSSSGNSLSSTSGASRPQDGSSGPKLVPLLGGVIGGVAGLIFLVVLTWLSWRRTSGKAQAVGEKKTEFQYVMQEMNGQCANHLLDGQMVVEAEDSLKPGELWELQSPFELPAGGTELLDTGASRSGVSGDRVGEVDNCS